MIETLDSRSAMVGKPTVLIVDDEPDLLELVSLTLSRMNLQARTAADISSARRLLKSEKFDLCLTDMRLPDGDGLDLVAWIQQNRAELHPEDNLANALTGGGSDTAPAPRGSR